MVGWRNSSIIVSIIISSYYVLSSSAIDGCGRKSCDWNGSEGVNRVVIVANIE